MEPSPKKLLLRTLAGQRTERPPVWLMCQVGRYLPEYFRTREAAGGMLGLCNSPQHATFADLSQLAVALGQTLEHRENDDPVLISPRLVHQSLPSLDRYARRLGGSLWNCGTSVISLLSPRS